MEELHKMIRMYTCHEVDYLQLTSLLVLPSLQFLIACKKQGWKTDRESDNLTVIRKLLCC